MKIRAGSFGHKGSVFLYSKGKKLAVEGLTKRDYLPGDIASIDARVRKNRSFGAFGFLVGAALFAVLGMMLAGIIGTIIGIAFAVAGSFYTTSKNLVDIEFTDGQRLTAEGTDRSIKRFLQFAQSE